MIEVISLAGFMVVLWLIIQDAERIGLIGATKWLENGNNKTRITNN